MTCVAGHGDLTDRPAPARVELGERPLSVRRSSKAEYEFAALDVTRARMVACGGLHTAVLTNMNEIFTWGSNDFGQLGVCRGTACISVADFSLHVLYVPYVYVAGATACCFGNTVAVAHPLFDCCD